MKQIRYPRPGETFIPAPAGTCPSVSPLDMPPEEADAIFGKEFMEEVRRVAEKWKGKTFPQFVQVVEPKEP